MADHRSTRPPEPINSAAVERLAWLTIGVCIASLALAFWSTITSIALLLRAS